MQRNHMGDAVILGLLCSHVCSLASSTHLDCAIPTDTRIAFACKNPEALVRSVCEGCHAKDSETCNMTVQAVLDQFPPLRACEELCGAIQELVAQCEPQPALQKRTSQTGRQSNTLINFEPVGSCTDQMRLCVSDASCNKNLARVLQACTAGRCDPDRCGRETRHFYASIPHNLAETLVMCECDPADHICRQMTAVLHGNTCGEDTLVCQEALRRCVEDQHCRELLTSFQAECWSPAAAACSGEALQSECFGRLDPSDILGEDLKCRKAFVATLGTALQRPCTCQQVHGPDFRTCSVIQDVLHNRSHFRSHRRRNGPSTPPAISESEEGRKGLTDYLLYSGAAVLFLGLLPMTLAVLYKMRLVRRHNRREETRFQPLEKSPCVALIDEAEASEAKLTV
ncbi:GDNF family receptor alpha-like isoform X1 [Nerophis ophidion]|uniref:GDNF family receptor alpha-like isoform X1 n=1 Tax=Nerophis ophidion TaxID=159077 RepID=UPI002ADFE794|nr:GDNF family receptor alpha-like isoform X1 [Nerophis ophidion]